MNGDKIIKWAASGSSLALAIASTILVFVARQKHEYADAFGFIMISIIMLGFAIFIWRMLSRGGLFD